MSFHNSIYPPRSSPIDIPKKQSHISYENTRPLANAQSAFRKLFQDGCSVSARVRRPSQKVLGKNPSTNTLQSAKLKFQKREVAQLAISSNQDSSDIYGLKTLVESSASPVFSFSPAQSLAKSKQSQNEQRYQQPAMLYPEPQLIETQMHTPIVQIIGRSSCTLTGNWGDSFLKNLAIKPLSESLIQEGLFLIKVFNEQEYEDILQSLNKGKKLDGSSEIASGAYGTAFRIVSKNDEPLVVKKGSPVKLKKKIKRTRDQETIVTLESSLEALRGGIEDEIDTWKTMIQTEGLYDHEKTIGLCFPKPKLILTYVERVKNGFDVTEEILRYSVVLTDMGPDMFSISENALLGEKPYPDSFEEFAKIFARQLTGLSIFQKYGFIHRDIKPENLTLRGWIDNGLSVKMNKDKRFTGFVGSHTEMPPEIILGIPHGPKIDSFSFSCSALTSFFRDHKPIPLREEYYNVKEKQSVKIPYDILNLNDPRITPQNVYLYTKRANHLYLIEKRLGKIPQDLIKQCSERVRNLFFTRGYEGEYSLRHGYHHYDIKKGTFSLEPFSYDYINQELEELGIDLVVVRNPRNRQAPHFMKYSTQKYINDEAEHAKAMKQVLRIVHEVKFMFKHYSELVIDASEKRKYSLNERNLFLELLEGGLQLDPAKRLSVHELLHHPYTRLAGPIFSKEYSESKMR